jgi:hypothetical protein
VATPDGKTNIKTKFDLCSSVLKRVSFEPLKFFVCGLLDEVRNHNIHGGKSSENRHLPDILGQQT